ncbi:MAG: helix-turn-helix transcriptional regulator [Prevotellaceae bacterium]|jgi:DNA-binding NarL/FixJ family response regulator|nr:helix-turn-helix transcriptional regulator [Prevotellaceae bacterium]
MADGGPFGFEHFADICSEAVYVIDFEERCFLFVGNNDILLCGHSTEEAMKLGYGFFPRIVHKDDLPFLIEVQTAILKRLDEITDLDILNYFSFSIRLGRHSKYIMVNHKIKPVHIDGQLRYGVCLLSYSVLSVPGSLRTHYYQGTHHEEYLPKRKKWERNKGQALTYREHEILVLTSQGKTSRMIANTLCISYNTLRNLKSSIFRKLNVHSMTQAVMYAFIHRLIFVTATDSSNQKQRKSTVITKRRRPITAEKLSRIQGLLNKGRSVNSISKEVDVSEFSIRYAIKTGKLTS